MALNTGDIVELEVTKVVHGGDGLTRHEGFVIFVRGGLPGERVLARVYSVKKSHAFADLIEVLVPSAHRVAHIWPEADVARAPEARAGGADYGHIDLDYQRVLKTDILREALTRYGGVSEDFVRSVHVEPVNGSADALRWRTRVTLNVDSTGLAGPYAERTNQVIAVDSLPLAASALEALGIHHGDWSGHSRIRLVQSSTGQPRVIIDTQKPQPLTEKVGDEVFHLSDHSFWQVHRGAAETLDALVSEALAAGLAGSGGFSPVDPMAQHFDLYSGVGLFAKAIGRAYGPDSRIIAVESDSGATDFTTKNLRHYLHSEVANSDVKRFLQSFTPEGTVGTEGTAGTVGTVVLDPPRTGAKAEVVGHIIALRPQQVIYVACDPVALGRDVRLFRDAGYELVSVKGVDLFPHTHHMEAVASLVPTGI